MNKTISWIVVILSMTMIFYFSHQPPESSNKLSKNVTEIIVENVETVIPNKELRIERFNRIVRKNAHFFIYLVLGVLVIHALRKSGVSSTYYGLCLAFLFCVLYAVSDELHQLFVAGRGAQVEDVFIDSAGAFVGIFLYLVIRQRKSVIDVKS